MHQNSDYVQTNENMTSGDTMKKSLNGAGTYKHNYRAL